MFDAYTLNNTVQYALPEEINFLEELGAKLKGSQIVMIGAGPGVLGLAALRRFLTDSVLDLMPAITVIDHDTTQWAERHFNAAGVPIEYSRFWVMDSAAAGVRWDTEEEDELGLLIVDGDHSELGVLRDLYAWLPHVTPRTHLFFHDYLERAGGFNGVGKWKRGGVAKAIEQFPQITVFEQIGISAYCRLKEDR